MRAQRAASIGRAGAAVVLSCIGMAVTSCDGSNSAAGSSRTASTTSPSDADQTTGPRCSGGQLHAVGVGKSSNSGSYGVVELTNGSTEACSLQGYTGISLPESGSQLRRLDVVHDAVVGPAGLSTGHAPKHPPPVVLSPGGANTAWVGLRVDNWCGAPLAALAMRIVLTDGSTVMVLPQGQWQQGRCQNSQAPAVIEEGPVQAPDTVGSGG